MTFTVERSGGLATLTFDWPGARNAIDRSTMTAFDHAVRGLADDETLTTVVLAARGAQFVAGGDLKDLSALDGAGAREMSAEMNATLCALEGLDALTIAAIDGDAYGGGCELALACDVRLLRRNARLVFKQTSLGLTPGWGGGQRLSALVGPGRATLLYATAATVDAARAEALGLVDAVVDDALAEAQTIAARVAEQSPGAVRRTKRAIREGRGRPPGEAFEQERTLFAESWDSPWHHHAVQRFLARKRD